MEQPSGNSSGTDVAGIHTANVTRFFLEHVPDAAAPLQFELISGGRSNLTYRVRSGERSWVLRRPPLGHVLPTAHDMAREYRVITALGPTRVPVARTYALCEDPDVNEHPFYVMEYCPGVVLQDGVPAGFAETPESCRAISEALIGTLVELHAVDYRQVGLEDFGRPEGYLERQVRRWSRQWEGNKTEELPEIAELIRRLGRALPASPPPTVVHGDYRLGNMALDPEDPARIVAIFDWEMATLGDPLADLGYSLIYWTERGESAGPHAAHTGADPVSARPGALTRAELIEAYAKASGRNVEAVDFYQVLALYKLAVISEGIYKRYQMGKTLGTGFENMARATVALARRALAIADASRDPNLNR